MKQRPQGEDFAEDHPENRGPVNNWRTFADSLLNRSQSTKVGLGKIDE